jgi:hypothetical protein
MTADQLLTLSITALLSGGGGIVGTIWYNNVKSKRDDRKNLFLRMITMRGHLRIPQRLVDDMNTIEVLFKNKKKIIQKYRSYYQTLLTEKVEDPNTQQGLYWDLLREMGNSVGYANLDNETLDNKYIPRWAMDDFVSNVEFRQELLGYLRTGQELQRALLQIYAQQGLLPLPPQTPEE